jgi:hypothetical protein
MDWRLTHATHRTDVAMDSAQKSQAAGQIVPPIGGAVPPDMIKQSKRGTGSYRLPDSLCNGGVRRNQFGQSVWKWLIVTIWK